MLESLGDWLWPRSIGPASHGHDVDRHGNHRQTRSKQRDDDEVWPTRRCRRCIVIMIQSVFSRTNAVNAAVDIQQLPVMMRSRFIISGIEDGVKASEMN